MAFGHLLLGREDLALRWLRFGFAQPVSDSLWLADFAAALLNTGRVDASRQLARAALRRLHDPVQALVARPPKPAEAWTRRDRERLRTYVRLLRFAQGSTRGAWRLADVLPRHDPSLHRDLLAAWNDSDRLAGRGFVQGRALRLRPPDPPPAVSPTLRDDASSDDSGETAAAASASSVASQLNKKQDKAGQGADGKNAQEEEEDDEDEDEEDEEDDGTGSGDGGEDDDGDDEDEDEEDDASGGPLAQALTQIAAPDAAGATDDVQAEDESDEPDSDRSYALSAGLDVMELGGLLLTGATVRGDFTLRRLNLPRFGLGLRASYVAFSDTHDWLNLYDLGLELGELELALVGRYRFPRDRGRIELGLVANLRTTDALPGGWLHAEYSPTWGLGRALLFEVNAGVNQVVADTNELRLLGSRDRIQGGIDWDLTAREFVNVLAGWQRYASRRREQLSDGYMVFAEAGHRLRLANPGWNLRITGYVEGNSLAAALPRWVARKVDSEDEITVGDIVVEQFAMVGLGTTVRRGLPGSAPADDRRFRYFCDLWVGYLWPLNQVGFDVQAGLGYSLPKLGELSLGGYFSNSRFGGGREGISAGFSLRWAY